MRRYRKGWDLDGVLVDFQAGFLERGRQLGVSDRLPPTPEEWNTWSPGDPGAFRTVWNSIKDDHSFWQKLPPREDAIDVIPLLDPTVYITARPVYSPVSMSWLMINEVPLAEVDTVCPRTSNKVAEVIKHELDVFVEDKHETFMAVNQETDAICLLVSRPYNTQFDLGAFEHLRVDSTTEAVRLIRRFEESNFSIGDIKHD